MSITENYHSVLNTIPPHVTLVAVSKFQPVEALQQVYDAGQRVFGENRVQEIVDKKPRLPDDIQWHMIGTLQSNKVKYIAPFVNLIHSVDSPKLLAEINKQAKKNNRVIDCLLEVHIAKEESKHGFSLDEADEFLNNYELEITNYESVKVVGLMGMATFTDNTEQVRQEFRSLSTLFTKYKNSALKLNTLSMGMTNDYKIAIEEGSTMVRIGSAIFGARSY